jgi:uncharacterized protein (DUF58 family)
VLNTFKQKFNRWLFRPQISSGTLTLNQRRIFILPTRRGLGFAFVLLLMLVGDINYNLSLGYVLTFFLATIAQISMFYAFRNLARLEIRAGHNHAVFCGDKASFSFYFHNSNLLPRYTLSLHDGKGNRTIFNLPAQHSSLIQLDIPSVQRGWQNSGRLRLDSEFPLGLFHAWSYIHFDVCCLVYPRPAAPRSLPATTAQDGRGKLISRGDDDFAGLRPYVAGDALPRIAWKALAREQGLQVKQFSAEQGNELWLDWFALPNIATEHKLELLTRWVLDAEMQGLQYGLRLPQHTIPPQHSGNHRDDCLRALALFGHTEGAR